jgi:hypothetical protein
MKAIAFSTALVTRKSGISIEYLCYNPEAKAELSWSTITLSGRTQSSDSMVEYSTLPPDVQRAVNMELGIVHH